MPVLTDRLKFEDFKMRMVQMLNDELEHHGILGQKWGVRRYQNSDGSLTTAGKVRYNTGKSESRSKGLTDKQKDTLKKVAIGVGVAAAAGIAIYGAYKYSDALNNVEFQHTTEIGKQRIQEARDRMLREHAAELQKMVDEGKIKSFELSNGHTVVSDTKSEHAAEMKKMGLDKKYGLTLNPDTKSSEIGSKKAAEVLNTFKDLAADSSNASKKATDAWQEGEQYTKKLLSKM